MVRTPGRTTGPNRGLFLCRRKLYIEAAEL
jgi:hypothetical protein